MTGLDKTALSCRYYVSYTGVQLPLKLITPLNADEVDGRITYMRAYYNESDLLLALEKVVYGEVEFEHRYQYFEDGRIKTAEMFEVDEEPKQISFE